MTSCAEILVKYHYQVSRPKIPETPEQIAERRSLAVLIRAVRGALGWSQKDLADQLMLSIASIAKLELALMRLTPKNHAALLELFKKSGVKFTFGAKNVTISIEDSVLKQLDPEKSLSMPRPQKRQEK